MPDINKMINDTTVSDPERKDRKIDLEGWDRSEGEALAQVEGIRMTDAHWAVVEFLRDFYIQNGPSSSGRELATALEAAFESQGGGPYLHTLFPKGPVAQGCRIGGIPVPPYTESESFGSAM